MSCNNCSKEKSLASRLNKRITILRQTDETDQYNVPLDVWLPVATVWAAIEPLRGREYVAAKADHADVTTRIRIRYRKDVDRTIRVTCDEVEFEILHTIHPDFNRRELHLMCKERQ